MNTKKRKLEDISGGAHRGRQPPPKRCKASFYELTEFLERDIAARDLLKGKKARAKSQFSSKQFQLRGFTSSSLRSYSLGLKVRREFSQEMYALVIYLRFGSILSDQSTWLSGMEVFRRTGVKLSS